jgi:RecA-family ATPase
MQRPKKVLIIGGGIAKTYAALDIAVCTALGLPWLGHKPQQCNVLYVNTAHSEADTERRIRAISNYRSADTDMPLAVMSDNSLILSTDGGMKKLYAAASDADLVIVDNFSSVLKSYKDGRHFDNEERENAGQRLNKFAVETNTAVLLLGWYRPSRKNYLFVSRDDYDAERGVAGMCMYRDDGHAWTTGVDMTLKPFELKTLHEDGVD